MDICIHSKHIYFEKGLTLVIVYCAKATSPNKKPLYSLIINIPGFLNSVLHLSSTTKCATSRSAVWLWYIHILRNAVMIKKGNMMTDLGTGGTGIVFIFVVFSRGNTCANFTKETVITFQSRTCNKVGKLIRSSILTFNKSILKFV